MSAQDAVLGDAERYLIRPSFLQCKGLHAGQYRSVSSRFRTFVPALCPLRSRYTGAVRAAVSVIGPLPHESLTD
jgi:hypothetical protein